MGELRLIPFVHLIGGRNVFVPHFGHPIVTIGIPDTVFAAEAVVLRINKVEVTTYDRQCRAWRDHMVGDFRNTIDSILSIARNSGRKVRRDNVTRTKRPRKF